MVDVWTNKNTLRLAGRLETGESFGALLSKPSRTYFRLASSLELNPPFSTFDGRGLEVSSSPGPGFFDSGLPLGDDFLLFRGIRRGIRLQGVPSPGRRVDLAFRDPIILASDSTATATPRGVRWASVDIETTRQRTVNAISLVGTEASGVSYGRVFFLGASLKNPLIESFSGEKDLLLAFAAEVRRLDPDILTGWNVGDFDFAVLYERFQFYRIPFDLGRTEGEEGTVYRAPSGLLRVRIPGRQVVDGLRIVRGSGQRFDDYRLETVAQQVLGRGKLVDESGQDKMAELERLYAQEPEQFCLYCLEDSRLVLDILSTTKLDALTLARSALTGVGADLAWTSIPTFEQVYALELIRRRVLPPPKDRDAPVTGAAGGTVLDPIPGLFRNVMVFDFRSLYPSIMRTFNIDPLAYVRAQGSVIRAPNEAEFSREPGILPGLLADYFSRRQEALDRGDETGAYVYKILMNSFYGVLGSGGCIYGRSEIAGAITSFGKLCLHFARDFFSNRGLTVLYGDTDSVFIYAAGEDLSSQAKDFAQELNGQLAEYIQNEYGIESLVHIRFERGFSRFLLPRLRAGEASEEEGIRGRAKGYAGKGIRSGEIEIKGMESARSDYTLAAQEFQQGLLNLVFEDAPVGELDSYVRTTIAALKAGELDSKLVYRKVLRRPAQEYTASAPPQVRAARLLGWTKQKGRISYLMTRGGPQPLGKVTDPLDYDHYKDHQLRPIWDSVASAVDLSDGLTRGNLGNFASGAGLQALRPLDDQLELGIFS